MFENRSKSVNARTVTASQFLKKIQERSEEKYKEKEFYSFVTRK